ncbi:MAG TPA: ThuA domain-containing protein [Bryobacterales bacterium]|nr:ThuA domain-containing protein [Bryobacterales bacterium]
MKSWIALLAMLLSAAVFSSSAADRRILLIAGAPSHGPGEHEQNAGVLLLQKWLNAVPGIHATVALNGAWPEDPAAIGNADAIFVFCDGAQGHLLFRDDRTAAINKAAARGAGLMFYHFAVEPPADRGHAEMLRWIGGYFELHYSVNPVWDARFESLPRHPITRGVKPFHLRDEWYYNIRFPQDLRGITPILIATPPADSLSRPDGPRSGNPDVRAKIGRPQCVVWAIERPDGGRGVGFVGGHFHQNLGNENFRKLVLNSLLWAAQAEVPPEGVQVTVTPGELAEHLDPKPARK